MRRPDEISERHLQAVWYDPVFRPDDLVARNGERVTVIHPGEWNTGPGPDFLGAVLETGRAGVRLTGDVEMHLRPLDWEAHGHGADPLYRRVIAHVTWLGGIDPPSLPPGCLSIDLGRILTHHLDFSPAAIDLLAYPYARLPTGNRPCNRRYGEDAEATARLLVAAGQMRLGEKARRLRRRGVGGLAGLRREQVFYEETLAAFGYRANAAAFREVARRVPFEYFAREGENAESALAVAALFAGVKTGGMRPRNRPFARLSAAVRLFASGDAARLADWSDFTPAGCRGALALLMRGGRLGRGRAAVILANVLAPWAFAEGRLVAWPAWLPPEDVSQPVRRMAGRLLGRDHNPGAWYATNGVKIQGLLALMKGYCLASHPDCDTCALGKDDPSPDGP